jgi:hypothetical protein
LVAEEARSSTTADGSFGKKVTPSPRRAAPSPTPPLPASAPRASTAGGGGAGASSAPRLLNDSETMEEGSSSAGWGSARLSAWVSDSACSRRAPLDRDGSGAESCELSTLTRWAEAMARGCREKRGMRRASVGRSRMGGAWAMRCSYCAAAQLSNVFFY